MSPSARGDLEKLGGALAASVDRVAGPHGEAVITEDVREGPAVAGLASEGKGLLREDPHAVGVAAEMALDGEQAEQARAALGLLPVVERDGPFDRLDSLVVDVPKVLT